MNIVPIDRFAAVLGLSLLCGLPSYAGAQPVSQLAELTSSRGVAGETFGWSVAVVGNTMVVGAPGEREEHYPTQSAALVFTNSGMGWMQAADLTCTNTVETIGYAVAISGDGKTIAVSNERKVLVFVEPAGGWTNMTENAELQRVGHAFGSSVAINADGSVIVASETNATLVYQRPVGGWSGTVAHTASLEPPPNEGIFGTSLAIEGNTVVVGAPGSSQGGAAYVYFLQPGPHKITPSAALTNSELEGGGYLGYSVAVSGDTIAAGTYLYGSDTGAVYVFEKPPGGWTNMTQTAILTIPPSGEVEVGYSVAMAGNLILAGAPRDPIGQNEAQGAAFVYQRPTGGWVNTSQPNLSLIGSDSTANDEFGYSVALTGTTAVIGAPFHSVDGNATQGAAYIFGP
jgi:hypothetical protein